MAAVAAPPRSFPASSVVAMPSREEIVQSALKQLAELIVYGTDHDIELAKNLLNLLTPEEAFQRIPSSVEGCLYLSIKNERFLDLYVENYGKVYPKGFTQPCNVVGTTPLYLAVLCRSEVATKLLLPFYSWEQLQMDPPHQDHFNAYLALSPEIEKLVREHEKTLRIRALLLGLVRSSAKGSS